MATITPTITKDTEVPSNDCWSITWTGLGDADTGSAVRLASASDRSVSISGTFAGATVTVQGSNDGSNWFTLTDPQGNPISRTSAGLEQIAEVTKFTRVVTSGGLGTSVNVVIYAKGLRT